MKYTSSQAGKLLRKLNDDYTALLKKEEMSKDFLVSLGENPDAIPRCSFTRHHGRHKHPHHCRRPR